MSHPFFSKADLEFAASCSKRHEPSFQARLTELAGISRTDAFSPASETFFRLQAARAFVAGSRILESCQSRRQGNNSLD